MGSDTTKNCVKSLDPIYYDKTESDIATWLYHFFSFKNKIS